MTELTGGTGSADARHTCRINVEAGARASVIQVVGHLDWVTARRLRDIMRDESPPAVVVDLSQAHLDSAGTAALMVSTGAAQRRGQRTVLVVTDPVQLEVFESLGMASVGSLFRTREAALHALSTLPEAVIAMEGG